MKRSNAERLRGDIGQPVRCGVSFAVYKASVNFVLHTCILHICIHPRAGKVTLKANVRAVDFHLKIKLRFWTTNCRAIFLKNW